MGTSSRLADVPDREQEEVDVTGAKRLVRGLLDDELPVPEPDTRTGGSGGREGAHVAIAALGEEPKCHRADRAGRADDADPRSARSSRPCSSRSRGVPAASRRPTAREGAAEGHLVRVFEIAAHREDRSRGGSR